MAHSSHRFSSFFNPSESTVVAEASLFGIGPVSVSFPNIFQFNRDNNYAADRFGSGYANIAGITTLGAGYRTNDVEQIPFVFTPVSLGVSNKVGVAVSSSSSRTAINSALLGSDSASTMNSTNNTLKLGTAAFDGFTLNGCIRKFTYWPTRLSNNRLRLLTT
jgi:hypothetical protein